MASDKVKTFTDSDFDSSIKTGVVLVDFWAEWCAPCRRLAPTVDQLAEDYDGRVTVAKVTSTTTPTRAPRFMVRGIPTLLALQGRRPQGNHRRNGDKDDLCRSSTSTSPEHTPKRAVQLALMHSIIRSSSSDLVRPV